MTDRPSTQALATPERSRHTRWRRTAHRKASRSLSCLAMGVVVALIAVVVLIGAPDLTVVAGTVRSVGIDKAPAVTVAPKATRRGSAPRVTTGSTQWTTRTYSMTIGGINRSYLVERPAVTPPSRLPVVVELGGCCTTVSVEIARADFRQVTSSAIVVYPEYIDGNWNAGACCGTPATNHVNDVAFVNAVIGAVQSSQADASTGPVYLAGYSNGGKLAAMMACQEPATFAGVAVYGATRTSDCSNPGAESLLEMVGSADPGTAISGTPVVQNNYTEPTVDQMVSEYRAADGCGPTASSSSTAGVATETLWTQCAGGHSVGVVVYQGDNHTWPEASGATPSAQQIMWNFFASLGA